MKPQKVHPCVLIIYIGFLSSVLSSSLLFCCVFVPRSVSIADSTRVKSHCLLLGLVPSDLILRHALGTFGDDGAVECHHVSFGHFFESQAHFFDDLLVLGGPDGADGPVEDETGGETQQPANVAHVECCSTDIGAERADETGEWESDTAEVGDDGLDVPTLHIVVVGVLLAAVVAVGDEEVTAGEQEVFADHDGDDGGHEETIAGQESCEYTSRCQNLPGYCEDCQRIFAYNSLDDRRLPIAKPKQVTKNCPRGMVM